MAPPATGTGATVYFIVGLYFLDEVGMPAPIDLHRHHAADKRIETRKTAMALPKLAVKRLTLFVPYFVNTPANQSATTAVPLFLIAGLPSAAASHSGTAHVASQYSCLALRPSYGMKPACRICRRLPRLVILSARPRPARPGSSGGFCRSSPAAAWSLLM